MQITLTNSFHNTRATVRPVSNGSELRLSARQVKNAWRKLCGMSGCSCGGPCGERGGDHSTASLQCGGAVVY